MELLCMIGCFFNLLFVLFGKIVDVLLMGIIGIFKMFERTKNN